MVSAFDSASAIVVEAASLNVLRVALEAALEMWCLRLEVGLGYAAEPFVAHTLDCVPHSQLEAAEVVDG